MPSIGPYRTLTTAEGQPAPWYIIPFDKRGRCKAPRTRAQLIGELGSHSYTHVYLFSHGWNNDWKAASERYHEFIEGFAALRRARQLDMPDGYRPLLIGVFWPSTSLVLPWERAPRFAAGGALDALAHDTLAADSDMALSDLAEDLPEDQIERFYELVEQDLLDPDESLELARLIAPMMAAGDEVDDAPSVTPDELAEAWMAGAGGLGESEPVDDDDETFGGAGGASGGPQAAGILSALDPRKAVRMATVWRMKDRAGKVGAKGVNPLLRDALAATNASFHLIGHSYGAKVVLSAVAHAPLPRSIHSVLLLQPAVNHRCFAADAGNGKPGGYRAALERVELPVMTTFSKHDFALTKTFHLAVRRKADLGEQRIAGAAPSRFAALGGYGPGSGVASKTVPILDAGHAYDDLDSRDIEVLALLSDRTIGDHGDINNESTWWALYEQARRI